MAHREEARNEFNDGFRAAAANKVQILATYNNRGRHTRIWILEAPDYHAVDKALEPSSSLGTSCLCQRCKQTSTYGGINKCQ